MTRSAFEHASSMDVPGCFVLGLQTLWSGRIPLVDPSSDDADPEARAGLSQLSPGGVPPNVYRAIANHPGALEASSVLARMVYLDSSITPAQRELAYLNASATNSFHY